MKRLILGKGKVSNIISKPRDVVLSRADCDIINFESLSQAVDKYSPDIIINCAAKTNLEFCQENKSEAFESNTFGLLNILNICKQKRIKLVHISSGCLFDGNNEVSTESSDPAPSVWYTWTKKWADEMIQNYGYENYLILRPRQLISSVPHPSNMLTKFSKMEKIYAIQEDNSITCIEDFSEMIEHLVSKDLTGIYNCANTGTITPYDIAMAIKRTINKNLQVKKTSYRNLLDRLPNRRVNTILSCGKLIESGFEPRSAIEALEWCLENYNSEGLLTQ